jgi:hypothetical protein
VGKQYRRAGGSNELGNPVALRAVTLNQQYASKLGEGPNKIRFTNLIEPDKFCALLSRTFSQIDQYAIHESAKNTIVKWRKKDHS